MAEMRHKVIEWRTERKQLAEQAGQPLRDAGDDALFTEVGHPPLPPCSLLRLVEIAASALALSPGRF